jgi:hypothetical protein
VRTASADGSALFADERANGCRSWKREGATERIAAGLVSLLIVATPAFAADLSPEDAGQHVGETATVCGTVASAHYSPQSRGKPTFLDMGHAYPDEVFTAVIWGDDRSKFGDPESLAGQHVCVTGPISQYRGRPEVVLRDPSPLGK